MVVVNVCVGLMSHGSFFVFPFVFNSMLLFEKKKTKMDRERLGEISDGKAKS